MIEMKFRPTLLTPQALKGDWNSTEWFGCEEPYAAYWDIIDYHLGYGTYINNFIRINIDTHFDYICIFKGGEFWASLEVNMPFPPPTILDLRDVSLLKEAIC